ncbi:MAG: alpha/beta fold hydrolase [Myxococcaceae bacterium]
MAHSALRDRWQTDDGVSQVMHLWAPQKPQALLFYIHGLQSHGGWLFESGPAWAEMGVAVAALDRRGSGESGGTRGDAPPFEQWILDYLDGLNRARAQFPNVPCTLLGQSMGGKLAAGLAVHPAASFEAFILCASGISQLYARLSKDDRERLATSDPTQLNDVHIKDEQYTRDARYLAFMRDDPKMLRKVTTRLRHEEVRLEAHLQSQTLDALRKPSCFIFPRRDPVIVLPEARGAFEQLTRGAGMVFEAPADDHYLEFSPWRGPHVNFVAHYVLTTGFSRR